MTLPLLFAAGVDAFCAGFFALVAWACSVTFHLFLLTPPTIHHDEHDIPPYDVDTSHIYLDISIHPTSASASLSRTEEFTYDK